MPPRVYRSVRRHLSSYFWGKDCRRDRARLISARTKEALRARRASDLSVGRSKGPGKSKLDKHRPEIEALLANGSTQKFTAKRKLAEEARNQETEAMKSYGEFGTFEPLGPSLPPVECCIGTRPSQDPKSRPRSKQLISVAKASIAKAVCSPTPGIVFNLCTLPDAFAMVSSCFVRLETLAASVSMCSTYLTPMLSAYERQQRGVPKRVRHSSTSL